jgi:hypothetical protein
MMMMKPICQHTDHAEIYLKKNVLIKTVTFHERASAIKVVLSCTGLAGKKRRKKKKKPIPILFFF